MFQSEWLGEWAKRIAFSLMIVGTWCLVAGVVVLQVLLVVNLEVSLHPRHDIDICLRVHSFSCSDLILCV